jgi:uracil-DNA glycosylase
MATRGQWWEEGGRQAIATIHPAAILRNEDWKGMWIEDLTEFIRQVQSG